MLLTTLVLIVSCNATTIKTNKTNKTITLDTSGLVGDLCHYSLKYRGYDSLTRCNDVNIDGLSPNEVLAQVAYQINNHGAIYVSTIRPVDYLKKGDVIVLTYSDGNYEFVIIENTCISGTNKCRYYKTLAKQHRTGMLHNYKRYNMVR